MYTPYFEQGEIAAFDGRYLRYHERMLTRTAEYAKDHVIVNCMAGFHLRYKDLTITEASNGFYIGHIPSDETRGMGDGVDMYTKDSGAPIKVGSWAFYNKLVADLYHNYDQLLEAYFPDQNYDPDDLAGAWATVIYEPIHISDYLDLIDDDKWRATYGPITVKFDREMIERVTYNPNGSLTIELKTIKNIKGEVIG